MTITWDPDAPFRTGAFGTTAEARRLRAAGLVRIVLGDVLVPAHREDSPELRATAAGLLLDGIPREAYALGYASAAWVHVGTPPPPLIELAVPHGSYRPGIGGVRVRQVTLRPGDVEEICGVRVTTAVRTAADVARDLPPDRSLPVLRRLRAEAGVEPHALLERLEAMTSVRGVVAARRLVRDWADGQLRARPGGR